MLCLADDSIVVRQAEIDTGGRAGALRRRWTYSSQCVGFLTSGIHAVVVTREQIFF